MSEATKVTETTTAGKDDSPALAKGDTKKKRKIWEKDIGRRDLKVLDPVGPDDLFPLPPPYDKVEEQPGWKQLSEDAKANAVCSFDGIATTKLPRSSDSGRGKEIRRPVRVGVEEAPLQGEQLGVPPTVDPFPGVLHRVPDLRRRLPRLPGHRQDEGDLPPDLPVRHLSEVGEEVRKARWEVAGSPSPGPMWI